MKNRRKKVLVLGYFGYETNQLDGQTIKTRNIYSLLKEREQEIGTTVGYFDTQTFQNSILNLLKVFKMIFKADILFYLPAHDNLKFIFPFIFLFSKLFKTKIHYVVVGGWLSEYLKNMPLHRWMLSKIESIYPQTKELVLDLENVHKLQNITQLNNFRIYEEPNYFIEKSNNIRLVFMARVHPLKGVNTLFKLESELIQRNIQNVIIDIYGPIFSEFENEFNSLIETSEIIEYKGILNPDNIYETLVNYDLMLFPTRYFTEGFPGSILDAYISHIPVIVSNWKYASEFVEDNESGIIVEFGKEDKFVAETIKLIESPETLRLLKDGAAIQAEKYSPDRAWRIIKNNI